MSSMRLKNLHEVSGFTEIPSGWKEFTISEECAIGRGRVISQIEIGENPGIYPVFSSQTRNQGRMGFIETYDFDGVYVTWTTDGENAGTVFYREGKFNCTNVCGTLKAKTDFLNFLFLSYLLGTVAKNYVSYIGNPKLMNGVMGSVGLIAPPTPQQQKIANILITVDNLIEQTQALIDKYTAVKQGMMADLFTRGIDLGGTPETNPNYGQLRPSFEEAPELYKETQLGWVPNDWDFCTVKRRIGTEGFVQTGPFGSQLHSYDYVEFGVPVIMPQDIIDGRVSLDKIAQITKEKAHTLSRHLVKHNDVVFSRRGDLTRAAYVTRELGNVGYFCGTGCLLMRVPENLIHGGWFSTLYPTRLIQSQIDGLAVGTTMANLNSRILGKLIVAFPSAEEQKYIFNLIISVDQNLDLLQQEVKKLQLQKNGLMQDLLTGKVQVTA